MSFKTILVSLNDVARVDEIGNAACRLASRHDAHIIGLFVIPTIPIYPVPGAYVLTDVIEAHEKFFAESAERVRSRFVEMVQKYDLRHEWRQVKDSSSLVADAVITHALAADLLVIGQVNPDRAEAVEHDFCDRIIMETGRPVVVVPRSGQFKTVGERVLVGWNATREAARAAFDALPIMESASAVWLTWVDPQREPDTAGQLPGSEMARTLSRHGIEATIDSMPTADLDVAGALLNRAADHDADLLVAGAYGHSRMREFAFGGATRGLLNRMTVPVLMSH